MYENCWHKACIDIDGFLKFQFNVEHSQFCIEHCAVYTFQYTYKILYVSVKIMVKSRAEISLKYSKRLKQENNEMYLNLYYYFYYFCNVRYPTLYNLVNNNTSKVYSRVTIFPYWQQLSILVQLVV